MNSLSWMIYLAEVFGRLSPLFGWFAFGIGVTIVTTAGLFAAMESDGAMPEGSWRKPLRFAWAPVVFGLLAAIIPSSTTIYLIAASEAGEAVVTSPDSVEMMGDLKAIIKKRLKEELAE